MDRGKLFALTLALMLVASPQLVFLRQTNEFPVQRDMVAGNGQLWFTTWGGPEDDVAQGAVVDANGSVYVTGYRSGVGYGGPALLLVKFDANGGLVWNVTWAEKYGAVGNGIALGENGSIFVVGKLFTDQEGNNSFAIVKFDSAGQPLWNRTWGEGKADYATCIAVDEHDNLFVGGVSSSLGTGNGDFVVVKFDSNGNRLWNATWGGASTDVPFGISLDASGNVYLAGTTYSFVADAGDFAVVKFNATGGLVWNRTWGGPQLDEARGVVISNDGGIYVGGSTMSFGPGEENFAVVKFDSVGNQIWNTTWGGKAINDGTAIATDGNGHVYMAGWTNSFSSSSSPEPSPALIELNSTGDIIWSTVLEETDPVYVSSLALYSGGVIYVAGTSTRNSNSVFAVIKLIQPSPNSGSTDLLLFISYLALALIPISGIAILMCTVIRRRRQGGKLGQIKEEPTNSTVKEDNGGIRTNKARFEDEGTDRLEMRRVSMGSPTEVLIDESSLTGTTLKVYWSFLSKRTRSAGLREIQRELGFSSPSSAVYQLEKLMRLGLVEKDDMGDYVVHRIVKTGFLRSFLFVGTHALPKDLIYCAATLLANFLCVGLLLSMGLSPLAYLALLPGVLSSAVFLYEAIRTWSYKQRVMGNDRAQYGEMEKSKIT